MKWLPETREYVLTPVAVDEISESIQHYFQKTQLEKRMVARYRLMIEELLLQTMDRFGEGVPVAVKTGVRLLKPYLSLEIQTAAFNPLEDPSLGVYGASMLKALSLSPEYAYAAGKNTFTFRLPKKKRNPLLTLLIAVTAALVLGGLGMLLPETVRRVLLEDILTPVHSTFLNLLSSTAGPMIFLSVAWGIYGIGDTATLGKLGKRLILGFTGMLAVFLVIAAVVLVPFFSLNFAGSAWQADSFRALFEMLLNVVPTNIFSPFVDGNTLQIIFMAIIIGIALLFLGQKTSAVARAVEQINYIVQFLMEFISSLVPCLIAIVVLRFIWSGALATMAGMVKAIATYGGAVLLVTVLLVLWTGLRFKVSPLTLVKKGLPTWIIGATTASSAACFGTNMAACERKYGVDSTLTSFGIPLGMVMFKASSALCFLTSVLFFAEMYQVECSMGWLVVAVLVVAILSMAAPPVPGGALTAYTVIFLQLGIPAEALAIVMAIDALEDFLSTGFDQFLLPFALIHQAGKNGLLNLKTLRKP